ncbi:MAG TPA: NUDIX hydrolase [Paracoccaceae bacterium]|nr:NUDIX hydrolase [Paracoccaceae bacterium]
MMRRFGEAVIEGQSYRTRHGAYAIIREGDDLLVTESFNPVYEIQLPGGGIDPGESPLQALHREVFEETGWHIAVLRRLGAFQRYAYMPEYDLWARKVCHIFLARPTLRLGAPSDGGHLPLWMPLETAARRLAVAGDRWFVARLLRRGSR